MFLFNVEGKYSSLFISLENSSMDFFVFETNFVPDCINCLKNAENFK